MAVAEMIARIKGVIVLPILTRYLGPLDFGVWSQVSMLTLLLSPVLSLGAEQGVLRILPGLPVDRQYRMFLAWILIALGGATVCATVLVLSHTFVSSIVFADASYERFIVLAAASLFATLLPNAARTWLRVQNDGNALAAATVAQAALGVVAMLCAVLARVGIFHLVLLGLVADLALGLVFLFVILRRNGWLAPDFAVIGPAIRYGLPLLPAAYAMWGLNWMDRLFLVHYQSLDAIGVYSAAYGLGYMVIQVFVNPIWALYPTSIAELHNSGDKAGADRLLHTITYAMLLVAVPAIAGLWALSEPIIGVVAGSAFGTGALVMPIIALAYLFHMLASFGDVSLGLHYRQHFATLSIFLAVLVNLALNLILIPAFGILGAACATLGAFLTQFIFSSIMAMRSGPFWTTLAGPSRVLAASLIMALAIKTLDRSIVLSNVEQLLVFVPTGAMLYFGLAVILGGIPRAQLKSAWNWLIPQKGPTA